MKYGRFYYIYDENGELMRITRHLSEAQQICSIREGWSYRSVTKKRPALIFQEALM